MISVEQNRKRFSFKSQNRKQWRSLGATAPSPLPPPPPHRSPQKLSDQNEIVFFLPASQSGNNVIRTHPPVCQGDFSNGFISENKCPGKGTFL